MAKLVVGATKELKLGENRVGLTPGTVSQLTTQGNKVLIGEGAGEGSGFTDEEYKNSGAEIIDPDQVWLQSDLIVNVKEPQATQLELINSGKLKGKILFTYLHLANPEAKEIIDALTRGGITGIAYETVSNINKKGRYEFPLLFPMSCIAGVIAVKNGAKYLEKLQGGPGLELGIVPEIENNPGKVVIIGGGAVGYAAAYRAVNLGADVTILDIDSDKRKQLEGDPVVGKAKVMDSTEDNISRLLPEADLLVGAVYVNGSQAPKLVTLDMTKLMKKGSVSIDVPIDQGGIFEVSSQTHTTLLEPTFQLESGQIVSAVPNMPGAVPRTASLALNKATAPYILKLAANGMDILKEDEALSRGLNIYEGSVVIEGVSKAHNLPFEKSPFV